MSAAIRLLVSDVDGTLVRRDKSLSDPVIAAWGRARDAGLALTIISARPPSGLLWIAERLGIDGALGAFNGGTIVRGDGTMMQTDPLDPEAALRAMALIDRPGITTWLFADGAWLAHGAGGAHDASERRASGLEPTVVDDLRPHAARADKIVGVCDDHALLAGIEPEVREALGAYATVARSQPYYLDVTGPRANKGDGVAALARAFDIPLSQVAVIGDQHNDLPMFARAGLSVAMGQAPAEVRAKAGRITLSNEEDGVADAIDRIILPAARA